MQNSKLIGGSTYIYDNYDVTLMPHSDKKIDIYVRDNFKMQIYEANGFEFTRINTKALQDALKRSRKDITCNFIENNCDGISLLELSVSIEIPLIPKITQGIFLKKTKTLKDAEIVNAKLLDIKKSIIKNRQALDEVSHCFGNKIVKSFPEINYSQQIKETVAKIVIPKKGKYLITISSFLSGNQNTYVHIEFTRGNINPGTYIGIPTTTQTTPLAFFVRTIIPVEDDTTLQLSGTSGQSYPWTMKNLIISAEKLSDSQQ